MRRLKNILITTGFMALYLWQLWMILQVHPAHGPSVRKLLDTLYDFV